MTGFDTASLLLHGALFTACGLVLARARAPFVLVFLTLSVGVGLLLWPPLAGPALRVDLVVLAVLLPLLALLYPDGRPAPAVGATAIGVVGGTGLLSLVYPEQADTGAFGLAQFTLVVACLWWRFDQADAPERRALLWLCLTAGGGLLAAAQVAFLDEDTLARVLVTLALVPVPIGLVIGVVWPDALDVRAVITRTVVEVSAVFVVVAVFVGAVSVVEVVGGSRPGTGSTALVAVACGLGVHPLRVLLLGVVDRLLFGDREDPVRAASHVGRTLDDPVLALRALRESLGLPYAALVAGDEQIAVSGSATTTVHGLDLRLGDRNVGRLDVGLRVGEVRMSHHDRTVLEVLAPALAQTLHARSLTRQLHDSRAGVIAAVEDERRRLRRDLHDGVGPTLTGIAFTADAARNLLDADPDRALELLASLRLDTAEAIREVRRAVEGLRPPAVDELGLVGALRQQVTSLHCADGTPLAVSLHTPQVLADLTAAVEVAAYRIVTEALTNVARHARSGSAAVCLAREGGRLVVEVTDSGTSTAPWVPGVGLTSMRDRAEELGGTFSAERSASGGRVLAVLPLG